jgi:hypothetical protein
MSPARFLLVLTLAGCLVGFVPFPVYKTLQPSAQITVLDEVNHPVPEAKVLLIANSNPYGREKTRETKVTNEHGMAAFEARHEWRMESFMMHGMEFFFWNWCVQKSGYTTYRSRMGSGGDFDPQPTIRLSPGASSECPAKSY